MPATSDKTKEDNDYESNKLFRKVVAEPAAFDGSKSKFHNWWKDTRLWLLGYDNLTDAAKIIAVLSRLTSGDAADWARVKKDDMLNEKAQTWAEFEKELVARFDDPSRKARALNDIHNYAQGKLPIQTYLDRFAVLKATSELSDMEALYLFKRGLDP